ncbi:hypothetical protein AB0E59_03735 [Lentzea sp. NPDC034063]|uniref:hypothetical protein n=1 Tax=unclassified Lentzea TaxID=2643253 RepID=UPI0033CF6F83
MAEDQMGGVRETVQQEGTAVVHHARDAAGEVRATAQDQFGQVAHEAKAQANHVLHDARTRVAEEAEQQARKASTQLGRIADELSSMAESATPDSMSAGAVRQVADTSRQAATYLDERGARGLLDSAQDFARRKPGMFLLGAAVAGFLVGRVAKSATGRQGNGQASAQRTPPPAPAVPEFAATPAPRADEPEPAPFDEHGTIGTEPPLREPYPSGPVPTGGARYVNP